MNHEVPNVYYQELQHFREPRCTLHSAHETPRGDAHMLGRDPEFWGARGTRGER